MAGKKRKKKKKNYRKKSLRIFGTTLALTIAVGCAVLFGSYAVKKADAGGMAVYAKGLLQRIVTGENGRDYLTKTEETDTAPGGTKVQAASGEAESQKGQPDGETTPDGETSAKSTVQEDDESRAETEAGTDGSATDELQHWYDEGIFDAGDKVYAKETADPREVSMVFAGDILFDDNYAIMARLKQRGGAIENSISADMMEVMRGADIFMLNNEFPYSDRGEPTPDKTFTFRGRPEYASYLLDMGVDIVSLANNHASDYGTVSLTDTIDVLNNINMPFVGAGRNLAEATQTAYFVANGMRIAILSATQIERMENPATKGATDTSPGVFRCLNIDRLLQEIQKAKQKSDFVIVYIHWGTESTDEIDWAQREQAPKIAEAGADLIIGDHPHVLQPIGYCGDVPVIYSLGNYLFNSKAQDTCLVRVALDSEGLKSLQFIPGRQQDCSVTMHYGEEKERVLNYMRSISPGVNIDPDGYITKQ